MRKPTFTLTDISAPTVEHNPIDPSGYSPDHRVTYRVGGDSEGLSVQIDLQDAGDGYFDVDISFPNGNEDWANPRDMHDAMGVAIDAFYSAGLDRAFGTLVGSGN